MTVLKIRGVHINYEVVGDKGTWLTFITGGRRGHAEFLPFAEKIADKGFRVLPQDRRNTGTSDVLIEGEDGEEELWADDPVLVLQYLNATPAFVGGTSSGARMSMMVYFRHPEAVKALPLLPFSDWAPHEAALAFRFAEFMNAVEAKTTRH